MTNKSAVPVKISNISVAHSGAHSEDFLALPLCPSSLPAGRSCFVIVSFIPDRNALGAITGSLVFTDNGAGSPQTVTLKATVINPRPQLNPAELSFGLQKAGTLGPSKSATLTNVGTSPLVLSSVTASGDFSLDAATSCAAGVSLAPGQHCLIAVDFMPHAKGPRFGAVFVKDNALLGVTTLALTGRGF